MKYGSTAVGMSLSLARGRPTNPARDTNRPWRPKSRRQGRLVLLPSYVISAILPTNARSWRVAERLGARTDGQMEIVGLTFERYLYTLATGGRTRLHPVTMK
jgi:hypothetical protein